MTRPQSDTVRSGFILGTRAMGMETTLQPLAGVATQEGSSFTGIVPKLFCGLMEVFSKAGMWGTSGSRRVREIMPGLVTTCVSFWPGKRRLLPGNGWTCPRSPSVLPALRLMLVGPATMLSMPVWPLVTSFALDVQATLDTLPSLDLL